MEIVTKDTSLKMASGIPRSAMSHTVIYHFYLKEQKLKNVRNLYLISTIRKNIVIHIKRLNDTLSHGLVLQLFFLSVLQIVNRVTKFSQEI